MRIDWFYFYFFFSETRARWKINFYTTTDDTISIILRREHTTLEAIVNTIIAVGKDRKVIFCFYIIFVYLEKRIILSFLIRCYYFDRIVF